MVLFFLGLSLSINVFFIIGIIVAFKIFSKMKKAKEQNFEDMLGDILSKGNIEETFEEAVVDPEEAEEFWS